MSRYDIERRRRFLIEKWLNEYPMTDEELEDWDSLFPDDDDDDIFGDDSDYDDDIFDDAE